MAVLSFLVPKDLPGWLPSTRGLFAKASDNQPKPKFNINTAAAGGAKMFEAVKSSAAPSAPDMGAMTAGISLAGISGGHHVDNGHALTASHANSGPSSGGIELG